MSIVRMFSEWHLQNDCSISSIRLFVALETSEWWSSQWWTFRPEQTLHNVKSGILPKTSRTDSFSTTLSTIFVQSDVLSRWLPLPWIPCSRCENKVSGVSKAYLDISLCDNWRSKRLLPSPLSLLWRYTSFLSAKGRIFEKKANFGVLALESKWRAV